jgi:hypothetical protein
MIVFAIMLEERTVKLVYHSIKREIRDVMNSIIIMVVMKVDINWVVKLIPQNPLVNYYMKRSRTIVLIILILQDV